MTTPLVRPTEAGNHQHRSADGGRRATFSVASFHSAKAAVQCHAAVRGSERATPVRRRSGSPVLDFELPACSRRSRSRSRAAGRASPQLRLSRRQPTRLVRWERGTGPAPATSPSQDVITTRQPHPHQAAGDVIKLADRLHYVLQPTLESLLAEGSLAFPFHPFPFQFEGVAFLYPRQAAILADEMGLGKTMQAITAIRLLLHRGQVAKRAAGLPQAAGDQLAAGDSPSGPPRCR